MIGADEAIAGSVDEPAATVVVAGFAGALGAGLRLLIGRDPDLRVLTGNGGADIAAPIAEHRPAAALVNHEALTEVGTLRSLTRDYPATGFLVGVPRLRRERDAMLLGAGARLVVPISLEPSELRLVVRLVARGLVALPAPAHVSPEGFGLLTERERQVFELLVRRRTMREVADALGITVATVNTHRHRIYEKLDVHSRAELRASAAASRNGNHRTGRSEPLLSRDRLPFRRRPSQELERGGGSMLDIRAATGMRRWRGHS